MTSNPMEVDGLKLDAHNHEFLQALQLVENGEKIIYLTGKAGTGKTTFLKYLRKTTHKHTVVLAPTGVAAINARGETIHRFFQINYNELYLPYHPDDEVFSTNLFNIKFQYNIEKLHILNKIELLIIDEVSMVRCEMLDIIDKILQRTRKKDGIPFGGVQVLMIGDAFQLPPVVKYDVWSLLENKGNYKKPFFFGSFVLEKNKPICIELKKVYRQKDSEFIELLNRIRVSKHTQEDMDKLNTRYDPNFTYNPNDNFITLVTNNKAAENINNEKLAQLTTQEYIFEASITGEFPESNFATSKNLRLKVGAQVICVTNITREVPNGTIGTISNIDENSITLGLKSGLEVSIGKHTFENVVHTWDSKEKKIVTEIVGTITQIPVRLGWAITVHKSQGQTFENVIIDVQDAFADGQVYVALSRCTSFNGLILRSKILPSSIKINPHALRFARLATPDTLVTEQQRIEEPRKQENNQVELNKQTPKKSEPIASKSTNNEHFPSTIESEYAEKIEKLEKEKLNANILAKRKDTELKKLQKEYQDELKKSTQLSGETTELKSERNSLKKEIELLNGKIKSLNKEIELLNNQTNSLKGESSLLEQENKHLRERLKKLENEYNLLKEENEKNIKSNWFKRFLGNR